ncbi:MAG: hypothetical protein F4Y35_08780 [Chloroflexi bacterium]|nr:hypothetical protein [Chloroflexota bacterium]
MARPLTLRSQHRQGGLAPGVAVRLGQLDIDDQDAAVLCQQETKEAEPGLLLFALAVELRLGVGHRLVHLSATTLAF